MFGWKGDALQKAMDTNCNVNCPALKTQNLAAGNKCLKNVGVKEDVDGCKYRETSSTFPILLTFPTQGFPISLAAWRFSELSSLLPAFIGRYQDPILSALMGWS